MLYYAIMLFLGTCAVSAALSALSRHLALKAGFVAHPKADRYHQQTVALGGGIGMAATLSLALISAMGLAWVMSRTSDASRLVERIGLDPKDVLARSHEWGVLLLCMLALFALGLWDDLKPLSPFVKLAVQFVVAFTAAYMGEVRVEFFIHSRLLTALLSAVWIMLLINVFNFLDNMDGACAGIAIIVSSILLVSAVLSAQILIGGLAIVFVGTLFGFLVFNLPPARLFMGDAGSLVVGFLVAVLSLRTTYYQQTDAGPWYPILVPLIALAVPLYDFLSVMALRISQGKNPLKGDTQHFSHRLRRRGLTERQTTLTLYLATLCTGLGATFLYQVRITGAVLIFLQTVMILGMIALLESKGSEAGP